MIISLLQENFIIKPDIIPILEGYGISVRVRGRKALARCPFHPERTASFTVWPEQNRYYCFGCQVSGDSFDLLAYLSGRPLAEILRNNNVTFEDRRREIQQRRTTEKNRDRAYARLAQLHRATIQAEHWICANVSEESPGLMANVFRVRDIIGPLLDKLTGDIGGAQDAIDEARERGLLWDG